MRPSRYLLLTLMSSLCAALPDDLNKLLNGEDVFLDLSSFSLTDHPIRSVEDAYSSEVHASAFLHDLNNELRQLRNGLALAEWKYKTNISDHNRQEFIDVTSHFQEWRTRRIDEAKRFKLKSLPEDISRQISLFTLSAASRDASVNQRKAELQGIMEGIYASGRTCLRNGTCLALEPDVTNIFTFSRDPDLLKDVWVQWRNSVGPPIKHHYPDFISLLNAGAVENGFSSYSDYWKQELFYDTPELDRMIQKLWYRIRPFYLNLHAYVRRKLREHYGRDVVGVDGTIPAHLLGNMWAQHWSNIMDIVCPFPEVNREAQIEIKLKLQADVPGMFKLAENFFKSIGFFGMTSSFWNNSVLVKPQGQNILCHASSFDMFYPGDYRIKMCSDVTVDNFRTIHHEMGHVEYFMAYADQPAIFREGANAAFHEAVGDTIGLSAMSVTHLQTLKLVDSDHGYWARGFSRLSDNRFRGTRKQKTTINSLLHMALEKVAFLPFGLMVDTWRWGVMQGAITPENYNRKWWEMRLEFQGIRSPVPRSENDFDPGAKYHIPANSAYIDYFISYVQQFQMYKAMCQLSSFRGPLHECDFYGSKAAGNKLRRMLSKGSSVSWQLQLKYLTGKAQVTTDAIMEYFKPLYKWLVLDNAIHQERIGWHGAKINWDAEQSFANTV